MMTRQEALARIKKLLVLADPERNPSPEEAEAARRKAQVLMRTHGIRQKDLEEAVANEAAEEFREAARDWAKQWVKQAQGTAKPGRTARMIWRGREFTAWEHASNNCAFEFSGGRKVIVCLDSAEELAKTLLMWAAQKRRLLDQSKLFPEMEEA